MRTHDLRTLKAPAIIAEIKRMQQEYFATHEAARTGKEKNHAQLKTLRRVIARAQTILREKEHRSAPARPTKLA